MQKVITIENNIEKTKYLNDEGTITFAADLGYAIMTVTEIEGGKLEAYYDTEGNQIPYKTHGYYAVFREFDEEGRNYKNTYLGVDGEPVMVAYGYAKLIRTYSENGRILTEKYYDTDERPTCTTVFGYEKQNKYDKQGRIIRQAYLDENGNPMVTGLGYASVLFDYHNAEEHNRGKIEREFYFDAEGEPVQLSLGQYGIYKEYDISGTKYTQTYLDEDGNPLITNKGYATIVRTLSANNAVATEMYYDANGNPISLNEGQYGVSYNGEKATFLDAEGNEQMNIKRLLFNRQDLVALFAIILLFLVMVFGKKGSTFLLILYCAFIIYITLMFRGVGEAKINLEPLAFYRQIFTNDSVRMDIINNIWLYVPLGAILYQLYPKKIIFLLALFFATFIEAVQYITGLGLCELDDVISNEIGAIIGFEAERVIMRMVGMSRALKE